MVPSSLFGFFVASAGVTGALVVSLFALIPGVDLGSPALVVAVSGLTSSLALGIVLFRSDPAGHRRRHLRLLVTQGLVFLLQGAIAVQLTANLDDGSAVRSLAVVTVVFFVVGILRARQLIGAQDTGLLRVVGQAIRERTVPPRPPEPA